MRVLGKPESGKSTLSKKVLQITRNHFSHIPGVLIAGFFFHNRGNELAKSEEGFLRGILHQILSQMSSLFVHILEAYEAKVATEANFGWSVEFLRKVLKAVLGDSKVKESVFIIDALDECPPNSKEQMISFITETITEY